EFGDAGRISLSPWHRRRCRRYVHCAGSYRRCALRAAQPRTVGHHGHMLARCSGASRPRRHFGHGCPGGEEIARASAASGGRIAVKATWAVLVFAMAWPTLAALGYFIGLASEAGSAGAGNIAFQTCYYGSKVVQFSLPVLWLGLWQGQK